MGQAGPLRQLQQLKVLLIEEMDILKSILNNNLLIVILKMMAVMVEIRRLLMNSLKEILQLQNMTTHIQEKFKNALKKGKRV